jgi:hypothetical protein
MALTKAAIFISVGKSESKVNVLFNPNEYSISSGNTYAWQPIPGLQNPLAQFISGEASTLTMDLFFDTYGTEEDVRDYTKKITNLLNVQKDLHAPGVCRFVWGSLNFTGLVEKVNQKYTMFLDSGIPVRATLNVTFKSYQSMQKQFEEIPRQSADRTKQMTLKQGDQLWMIADEEYEEPGLWREIARANGINNPRHLENGRTIIIPRLE